MKRLDYDPLKALILRSKGEEKRRRDQIKIDLKPVEFAYPKMRAVDHGGQITANRKIRIFIGGADD